MLSTAAHTHQTSFYSFILENLEEPDPEKVRIERPQELKSIYHEEERHFTIRRSLFVLVNFILLMINNMCYYYITNRNIKISVIVAFTICMMLVTMQ